MPSIVDQAETADHQRAFRWLVRPFADAVRSHWGFENTLHWSLDVTSTEYQSRIRKGAGPETTALLRRVALSKLQLNTLSNVSHR